MKTINNITILSCALMILTGLPGCVSQNQRFEDFLYSNPKVLETALSKLAVYQELQRQEAESSLIESFRNEIYGQNIPTVIGRTDAPRKIVMFSDYNCAFCKIAVRRALESDEVRNGRLAIIIKDVAIISKSSEEIAKYGIAAGIIGNYENFQSLMLNRKSNEWGEAEKKTIANVVSLKDIAKIAKSEAVQNEYNNNMRIAKIAGVKSTPTFVIDKRIQRGWSDKMPLF